MPGLTNARDLSLGVREHGRLQMVSPVSRAAPAGRIPTIHSGQLTKRETGGDCSINGGDPDYGLGSWCNVTVGADSFSYDATGNRTDRSAVIAAANRISSFNGLTFTYDADGNITRKASATETRDYYWSATGQLDSVVHNDFSKVRYDYNALGQPVRKWRGDPNGMYIENYFVWDGDQLLLDLDSLGNRIGEYVYHPGTIDSPFGVITGSSSPVDIRYYQEDQLGNVIGYSAGSTVTMKVSYDSWGVRNVELADYNRLHWKGLIWEGDAVGLYYMRNRWYDPETGRFMSEDPIGHAGGINLYAFANNDPINGIDPSGLCPPCQLPTVIITARRDWPFSGFLGGASGDIGNQERYSMRDRGNDATSIHQGPAGRGGVGTAKRALPPRRWRGDSECYAAIGFASASLALDAIGGRAGATALFFSGKAAVTYIRSWNPALVRELGLTFGMVEQKRLATAALGFVGASAPDMTDNVARWATQTGMSGEFNPFEILPGVATVNAGRRALGKCYR